MGRPGSGESGLPPGRRGIAIRECANPRLSWRWRGTGPRIPGTVQFSIMNDNPPFRQPGSWRTLFFRALLLGFPVLFAGPKAGAWGNFGHESIALVAWVELSPAQKAAVDAIFAGAPSIYGTSRGVGALMFAATWPDVLREGHEHGGHLRVPLHIFQKLDAQYSDAKAVDNLHFADFDEATEKLAEPADNVATAVNIALGFLRDRNSTPIQKGEALSYLIHCVGDAHQPLHAGYIGDLGGNHIAIQKLGGSTSLHAAWDTGFFATTKYYVRGRTLPTAFVSDVLVPLLPTVQSDALASLNPADWVTESHSLAKKYAYLDENGQKIATGATLSGAYVASRLPIAEKRLAEAGLRLAAMLKEAFP